MSQKRLYWEKQDSQFCAVHAVNNLLQGSYFDEVAFSQIAQDLHEEERKLAAEAGVDSPDYLTFMAADSQHVDETGNFSIEVISKALAGMGIALSAVGLSARIDPEKEEAFLCNHQHHWLALRKLRGFWFNLDSLREDGPELVSDFFLDAWLAQLRLEGYSIFALHGKLPRCPMTDPTVPPLEGPRGTWLDPADIVAKGIAKQQKLSAEDAEELRLAISMSLAPSEQTSEAKLPRQESDPSSDPELRQAIMLSLQETAGPADREFAYASELASLRQLGFMDEARCRELLVREKGDLERVAALLCEEQSAGAPRR